MVASPDPSPSEAVQAGDWLRSSSRGSARRGRGAVTAPSGLTFDEVASRSGGMSVRSGGSSTRPASGWRPGDGGDSLVRTASDLSRRSGSWETAWLAATRSTVIKDAADALEERVTPSSL